MANRWEFDWYMIERYDPVDISIPDIGLGVFGLWRLLQMTRFMGLHVQLHSNSELGVQTARSAAPCSARWATTRRAPASTWGRLPRLCLAMDTEYNQVSDDVLVGGKLRLVDGHVELSQEAGHGRATGSRQTRSIQVHRRKPSPLTGVTPRSCSVSTPSTAPGGRPSRDGQRTRGPSTFDRLAYPYDLRAILGLDHVQDVDVELNT